jgi:transcriptional regulator with XRE-family HTH domain
MKITNISERLKKLMLDRNLRQIDILNAAKPFCDRYGIRLGKNDLSQYISGKVEPGQEKLTILGLALDVSEMWLMGYDVPSTRKINYSAEELADLYFKGAKGWATDFRFSQEQKQRINEYIAEITLKLKTVINNMADAGQCDGKILATPYLQRSVDDLSHWGSLALKYVNDERAISDDPFSEDNIKEDYLAAIAKLSRKDQVKWLIRIQDYIDETKEST